MTTTEGLAVRIAANIRREMAGQSKKVKDLATVLDMGYRATLERHKGKVEYLPSQVEDVADWLGVDVAVLIAPPALRSVAA